MLIFTVTTKLHGGKPQIFGYEIMTVLSGSMEPGIKTGSIIAVKPVKDKDQLQKGDVITFRSVDDGSVFITHRIIDVKTINSQVHYITKGDNNDAPDPEPIPASNVVAKYENITIPYLGYVFNFAKSKAGVVLLMIIPGITIVIYQLFNVWRMIASMDEKKEEAPATNAQETT
jgi:signal peptidase